MRSIAITALGAGALMLFSLMAGCAASGPKYIDLAYEGAPKASAQGTLGISMFTDKRADITRGQIGHRVLNDKSKEVFLVQGLDLSRTLTNLTQTYLEKKGFTVSPVPVWTPDLEGLAASGATTDYILTGHINKFDCRAKKNGALTEMILEIDLTLFLGSTADNKLTTIPVALSLERTDIRFTREKVEGFFNQTLAEVFGNALPFD